MAGLKFMSRYSKQTVEKYLRELRKALKVLNGFKNTPLKTLKKDMAVLFAVLHSFMIVAESILDIGGHVLSAVYQESYDAYKDIVPLLIKHNVISKKLGQKLEDLADFRNKLVHGYPDVDPKKIHQYLKQDIPLFESFAKEIIKFMERVDKKK